MNEQHENTGTQQDEEALYEIVAAEMAVRKIKNGLWAKAYAQCEGDTNRTKALYIKLRVQALKDEAARMAQPAHLPAVETESERMQPEAPSAPEEWQDQRSTFLGGKTHPWRRFFARVFDNIIACISLGLLFVGIFDFVPDKQYANDTNVLVLLLLLLLLSLLVEPLFLHWFGTTPAKWLFGIRVVHPDGTLLTFVESLKRLFLYYTWGGLLLVMLAIFSFALLLALVFYFYPEKAEQIFVGAMVGVFVITNCMFWGGAYLFAYRRLAKTGTTRWDSATNAVVVHKEWGVFRTVACIACACPVVLLYSAGAVNIAVLVNILAPFLLNTQNKGEDQNVQQNYEQPQSQNKKDAAQGDADAQNSLGVMYEDFALVQCRYEKAAAQGDVWAQYNLGWLYYTGWYVQDYAQARSWFEKVAAQGDKVVSQYAQYNLGLMYYNGQGVPQDYAQARRWWEKAAAQGDVWAQYKLGVLYSNGQGVRQDKRAAKEWFGKACRPSTPHDRMGCDEYQELEDEGY